MPALSRGSSTSTSARSGGGGGGGASADVEVIAVALECLETVGVTESILAIGHAGVVTSLLDEIGIGPLDPRRDQALESLNRRDPRAVEQATAGATGSGAARRALIGLAEDDGIRQSIDAARKSMSGIANAEAALAELETVVRALEEAGLRGRVAIDLSESRALDYYTGLVFRIYGAGLGFDVGGGGRYDSLLGRLGRPMPAIGFMLGLDRLALLVERAGALKLEEAGSGAKVQGRTLGESVRLARERRSLGQKVRFEGPR